MHEIITLQLGQRSNYLATHFWNVQESYFTYFGDEVSPIDHDISFRPGLGADGSETFTPRTIIYDLKGGFGSLRQYNALYEAEEEVALPKGLWDGNKVIQRQSTIPQNEYLKTLELGLPPPKLTSEAVRYWSDFNRIYYHPKSIVQLNQYDVNSQMMPFEDWAVGEDLFNTIDREHDLLDRDFRAFAEECDQLKGIQIFTGADDAWAGFAARYIDRLRDEFGKKNIWTWALDSGGKADRTKEFIRKKNSAKCITEISTQSTVYVPISALPSKLPSYLNLTSQSEWYLSAVTSMAVESVTLPARFRWNNGLEPWLLDNSNSQRIFALKASFRSEDSNSEVAEELGQRDIRQRGIEQDTDEHTRRLSQPFDIEFSPIGLDTQEDTHIFSQLQVLRDSRGGQSQGMEVGQGLTAQRHSVAGNVPSHFSDFKSKLEYPVLDSFPSDLIRHQGPVGSTLGVDVALSTTSTVGRDLKNLQKSIVRRVGVQEREDLMNGLSEISEAYQAHWEADSDSGEDE